jgi:hypothetical protein
LPPHRAERFLTDTGITPELVAAYRATEYRVGSGVDAFVLRIDVRSEPLARLYAACGVRCAAFMTACNPHSRAQTTEANRAALARLREALGANAYRLIEAAGVDPSGVWPAETSVLALGLGLEDAKALGRRFDQNAIVWAAADAIPRLVLLR